MKVLIVSDTHGRDINYKKVIERVKPIDLMIHLGDYEGSEEYIQSITPCKMEMVSGNNDFFTLLPKESILKVKQYTIFITHGHRYGVNRDYAALYETGKKYGADIVMCGHTHIPHIEKREGIWIINPGSLSLPRQQNRLASFIIMDIDSQGEVHFTLNHQI